MQNKKHTNPLQVNSIHGARELLEKLLRRCVDMPPAGSPSPTKHISLNMDADLHRRLKLFCVQQNTNVSTLVSELASAHLAKHKV